MLRMMDSSSGTCSAVETSHLVDSELNPDCYKNILRLLV